jgi:S1-C subfamily serine protease
VAGIISAILVLLAFPAAFGVNPYDIIRGKVQKVETQGTVSQSNVPVKSVSLKAGGMDVSDIAKTVVPSIVNIDVSAQVEAFPGYGTDVQQGTGSGVIYRSDGYILTNNHVVGSAQSITVTLASGEKFKGTLVGTDPASDVAVVKIDKTGLPAISIGNSGDLVVGQLAVAIGSPYGFEQSVTSGIVSALHRDISEDDGYGQTTTALSDLIQTDAAINPGNSGGALCDSAARLIGLNTIIASSSGGSEGVGFSIPVNTAKKIADQIISGHAFSGTSSG